MIVHTTRKHLSNRTASGITLCCFAITIVFLLLIALACDEQKSRVEIPSFGLWVEEIDKLIPIEKRAHLVGGFGSFDTLHIVSEFTGATSPMFKAQDLTEWLKSRIMDYLPYLTIVEGAIQTDANLWLEVNLTAKADGSIYGHTRIEFRRDVIICTTNFADNRQVWEDLITFDCDQNPGPDIHYNIELHAKKLCAMIILAKRYQ